MGIFDKAKRGKTGPRGPRGPAGPPGASGGSPTWDSVTGKPSTFPPSTHSHAISDVTGLQAAIDAKQVTLVSGTNIKTVNGSSILGSGNVVISADAAWGSITGTLSSQTDLNSALSGKAATSHTHAISDTTGLQTALDGKAASSHSHVISDVTGLQTALDGKQASGSYAAASHTHSISDVTSLQTTLDGKAASTHSHAISDVTGLQTALDGKQASGSYAASTHTHVIGDVTNLQTTLDAKLVDESVNLAYQALGSTIRAETLNFPLATCNTSSNLTDGQIRWIAVYLPKAATLTGVKVYMRVAGNYTGDNTNGAALYTYSGGTLTQVAVSSNTSTLWTASANARLNIPFTGTYAASAGIFFVAILYNQSAQTTAPAVATGTALNNAAMSGTAYDFTNSAKLYGTSNSATLPASIAMSSITASTAPTWVALY